MIAGFYAPAMRLSQDEQSGVAKAARPVLPAVTRVSLFGSRAHDARRDCDIDLLVEPPALLDAPQQALCAHALLPGCNG